MPAGGWFMTAADHERLIAREKPTYDGAEPSGTSVALLNALRLGAFTSDDRWRAIADRAFAADRRDAHREPARAHRGPAGPRLRQRRGEGDRDRLAARRRGRRRARPARRRPPRVRPQPRAHRRVRGRRARARQADPVHRRQDRGRRAGDGIRLRARALRAAGPGAGCADGAARPPPPVPEVGGDEGTTTAITARTATDAARETKFPRCATPPRRSDRPARAAPAR